MSVTRVGALAGLAVILVSRQVEGQPPDVEEIRKPHMVVLATATDEEGGRREAIRAAERLRSAVAPDTLRKPAQRRIYVGHVITLQRADGARFFVVSYLGGQLEAVKALGEARKHYPDARLMPAALPKQSPGEWIDAPYYRLGVLVLGSHKSYEDALRAAKSFGARSNHPYGSRGMVYDKQRGLIWPDGGDDETWAGHYAPRRYDNECDIKDPKPCITVERSEAYEGFTPGLYIVVGGILGPDQERAKRLAAARQIVPGAYVKQTTIYLGCMH